MAWKPGPNSPLGMVNVNPAIVDPAVTNTPVGLINLFVEDTLGYGELIYLPGVAGLVAGDVVFYDLAPAGAAVVRATTAVGANTGRVVAIAVGAPQAGQFGWFQISGTAICNVTGTGSINAPLFTTATAGGLSSTATAGAQIAASRSVSAVGTPSAGKLYATLNRPQMQTQIT